jgi:hypothetical protein
VACGGGIEGAAIEEGSELEIVIMVRIAVCRVPAHSLRFFANRARLRARW